MILVVLVFSLVLAIPQRAYAACAHPSWVGTESSSVPTRGSLYVYDEIVEHRAHQHEVRWNGTEGVAVQTKVAKAVVRIDYSGPVGSELVVNRVGYRLTSDWRPPVEAPFVVKWWHHESEWTCSSSDTLNIEISQPTAAVRVRWTFRGDTTETIVPTEGNVLELGKINCGGTTLDPDELRAGGHLELTAIRLDGSEVAIRGLPAKISTSMFTTRFYVIALFVLSAIPLLIIWYRRRKAHEAVNLDL
ncbi:MAG TPA: hypothetical protein VIV11_08715 [Kofleriaceae bacterium]